MPVVLVYLQYISAKIHSKCASQPKIAKNSHKSHILQFKVVQGHRSWYPQKARQQCTCLLWYASSLCLSVLMLKIACACLSWSISSDVYAVHSWNVRGSLKTRKKFTETPILGFKVVQSHRRWYPLEAPQQCLLRCAASLCLSATVLVLD